MCFACSVSVSVDAVWQTTVQTDTAADSCTTDRVCRLESKISRGTCLTAPTRLTNDCDAGNGNVDNNDVDDDILLTALLGWVGGWGYGKRP